MRKLRLVLAVIVLAVFLAGCGDDVKPSPTPTPVSNAVQFFNDSAKAGGWIWRLLGFSFGD